MGLKTNQNKPLFFFVKFKNPFIFAPACMISNHVRAISSVGSEHLVYTQGVGGSNPSLPTDESKSLREI